jgi:hypothetical protein
MISVGRLLVGIAGALIALGGCYDLFTSKLPPNFKAKCADHQQAARLTRELLRALGGALVAIGAAIVWITIHSRGRFSRFELVLLLLLAVPSEGVNAFAMRRVSSPWPFPVAFLAILLVGVILCILP